MAEPDPPNEDDARRVLERELYWAGDPSTPTSESTRQLRIALHDFAAAMRADSRSRVPRREPLLGSASRWKRSVKVFFYVALRPITHRYDRLLGDLATLNRMLAERLADAEAEIASLRRELEDGRRAPKRRAPKAGGPGGSRSERERASGSPPKAGGPGGSRSERERASGSPPKQGGPGGSRSERERAPDRSSETN